MRSSLSREQKLLELVGHKSRRSKEGVGTRLGRRIKEDGKVGGKK